MRLFASIQITDLPFRKRYSLAANPAAPAPTTITSGFEAREIFGILANAETDKMYEINCLRLKKLNFLYLLHCLLLLDFSNYLILDKYSF